MSESRIRLDPDQRDAVDSAVERIVKKKKRGKPFGKKPQARRHSQAHMAEIVTRWLRRFYGRPDDAPQLTRSTITNAMERKSLVRRFRRGTNKAKIH